MDEEKLWQVLGLHNALAQRRAAERLTPEQREAAELLAQWQQMGMRHVTLDDAVKALREQKAAAPAPEPQTPAEKLLAEWEGMGVQGFTLDHAQRFLDDQRARGLIR